MAVLIKQNYIGAISLVILLSVTGCKTTNPPVIGDAVDSLVGQQEATETRLTTAAKQAIEEDRMEEALVLYARLYKSINKGYSSYTPEDQKITLNYAQLLRKTGKAEESISILNPLMHSRRRLKNIDVDAAILNEYAASHIEIGELKKSEEILNRVLEDKDSVDNHPDAYNLLGITLDAQSQHKEAEHAFRIALEGWKGKGKTSVMNNLAINLASQGIFDESLLILRQALIEAPKKEKIAHNIQMITDLRKSIIPQATAPINIKKK